MTKVESCDLHIKFSHLKQLSPCVCELRTQILRLARHIHSLGRITAAVESIDGLPPLLRLLLSFSYPLHDLASFITCQ